MQIFPADIEVTEIYYTDLPSPLDLNPIEKITTLADVKKPEVKFSIEQLEVIYKDLGKHNKEVERTKRFIESLKRLSQYL